MRWMKTITVPTCEESNLFLCLRSSSRLIDRWLSCRHRVSRRCLRLHRLYMRLRRFGAGMQNCRDLIRSSSQVDVSGRAVCILWATDWWAPGRYWSEQTSIGTLRHASNRRFKLETWRKPNWETTSNLPHLVSGWSGTTHIVLLNFRCKLQTWWYLEFRVGTT